MASEDNVRRVVYCPHCGNRAPQELIHTQQYTERSWSWDDGSESEPTPWSMFVAVCGTCHQVLLYENLGDQLEEKNFMLGELVFPDTGRLPISVPQAIAEIYEEARRIRDLAPNAFAVQIRRALEALCEDRGAKKDTLQKQLSELASLGEIPDVLAEASNVLRLIGNIGAHGISTSVHPSLAPAIDDFFRAIIEYVYVAPSKLNDFRIRMSKYTSE